jgi:acyl-CoA thioester hydrolase
MRKSWHTLRVRYAETDQMGVAHHGSYFIWMEAARTELLRKCGLAYRELEKMGYMLPVREAHCRYKRAVEYDDMVAIQSWISHIGGASLKIEYRIYREGSEDQLMGDGYTLHAFTDGTGKVIKMPQFFRELIT